MANRGRPKLTMTSLRLRVRDAYIDRLAEGYYPTHAELSRDCGLYSYRDARRVLSDLKKMGAV